MRTFYFPIFPSFSAQTRIYKSFIRPHLDYGNIVYDQAFNESVHKNLESIRYNAPIEIHKRYMEQQEIHLWKTFSRIRLRILKIEIFVKKIMFIYKLFHKKYPSYLFQLIPPNNNVYVTRSSQSNKISSFDQTYFFQRLLFSAVISE